LGRFLRHSVAISETQRRARYRNDHRGLHLPHRSWRRAAADCKQKFPIQTFFGI